MRPLDKYIPKRLFYTRQTGERGKRMDFSEVMQIIHGSKQYEFHGPVLTVTGYYTGKKVKLDLSRITEEMLEELTLDDEEDEEYEY